MRVLLQFRLIPLFFRTFSTQSDFENAQKNVLKLPEEPDVDVKLSLYGLFKQASIVLNLAFF